MQRDIDPVENALTTLRESVLLRLGYDVLPIESVEGEGEKVFREMAAFFGYPKGKRQFTKGNTDSLVDDRVYFIPLDKMAEFGDGNVTEQTMAKALIKQGHLIKPGGKNLAWDTIPGRLSVRHYRVKGSFFHRQDDALEQDDGEPDAAA